jgi:hypothetical protein
MTARLLALIAAATAGFAAVASAEGRLEAPLSAYVEKHGLPVRRLSKQVGGRAIQRVFVPVTRGSEPDFLASFSAPNGALVLRPSPFGPADIEHPILTFGHDRGYSPYQRFTPHDESPLTPHLGLKGRFPLWGPLPAGLDGYVPRMGAPYPVLALDPAQIEHVSAWLESTLAAGNRPAECVHGSCMWWLVHLPVAPGLPLAHALGVRQAKVSSSLVNKLVHAGNERVPVVGIEAASAEGFMAMDELGLWGAPPAGGLAEAVKE